MNTHTQKINPLVALIGATLVITVFLFSGEAHAQSVHSESDLALFDSNGLDRAPDMSIQANPEILPPSKLMDSTDLMYVFFSTGEDHPMNLLSDSGFELTPAVLIDLKTDGEITGAALGVNVRF